MINACNLIAALNRACCSTKNENRERERKKKRNCFKIEISNEKRELCIQDLKAIKIIRTRPLLELGLNVLIAREITF